MCAMCSRCTCGAIVFLSRQPESQHREMEDNERGVEEGSDIEVQVSEASSDDSFQLLVQEPESGCEDDPRTASSDETDDGVLRLEEYAPGRFCREPRRKRRRSPQGPVYGPHFLPLRRYRFPRGRGRGRVSRRVDRPAPEPEPRQNEGQQILAGGVSGGAGPKVRSRRTRPLCYNCRKRGHLRADCKAEDNRVCHRCKQVGHLYRDCPADEATQPKEEGERRLREKATLTLVERVAKGEATLRDVKAAMKLSGPRPTRRRGADDEKN